MPSTRHISKPGTGHTPAGMLVLLLVLSVAFALALPVAKAYAAGGTTLGILVIDSSDGQTTGNGGTTKLGIRVTNSLASIETQYTLTLYHNDGTEATSSVDATYKLPLPDTPRLTRTGYTFLGYFSATSGGTQYYKADGTYARVWDQPKAIPLYAQWQAKTTQVSFDQNAGSGGQTAQVTATYDSDMPAITSKPTKDNHTFLGYFGDARGGTKYYNADLTSATTWDKERDTATLYAQWQINSYTMTWNANGGSWAGSTADKTTTVNYDALVTPPEQPPSRPGYKFDGWYKEGLTVPWNFQTDKPTQNTTLYAKWSEQILCTVPVSTLLQVDAKGDVTDIADTPHEFVSQTTAPIVVESATSTLLAGANTLFPDDAARKDVAILIKPEGGQQKSIPLATTTSVSLGFQIGTKGTLPVSFGLHLPATARLNYLANDGTAEIASISYTVSLAS